MQTELFEIELTICIKMDLKMLICHKTQPTNQPTFTIMPRGHPLQVLLSDTNNYVLYQSFVIK